MWYLIGVVAIFLAGFFVYASIRKSELLKREAKKPDKPLFRSEEDLNSYDKPMNDDHSHVDFDDAE